MSLVLGTLPTAMAQTTAAKIAAQTALSEPGAANLKAVDLGELKARSGATPISVTIALGLPKLDEAEGLLISLHTPGDPKFHQFLTADQFVARFAPANADVAKVISTLNKYGITAERTTATTLRLTGRPAELERAFSVSLHSYAVPAHGIVPGYTFHAPLTRPTIPAEIAAYVVAVVGLDSRPSFRSLSSAAPQTMARARSTAQSATPHPPGYWTVTDFADYYDVQPLYISGVSGNGRTLGIVTLASFTPSDAFAYWNAVGIPVSPNRIQIVDVDDGPGPPSDASDSQETTLDVEQSGGVAPGANIIVYQAPNTYQGWVDAFATAVDANSAESLSTSWITWEWFANLENGPVIDPNTGRTVGFIRAVHELLVRAAIQGQSFFAASGDGGPYTVNWYLGCFGPYSASQPDSCSQPLSVGYPASDPAITAAGGTTLAGVQEWCLNAKCTPPYDINIRHERVWGEDYLDDYCAALGYNPITCGAFPYGSTGGVSIICEKPSYQSLIPGTEPSQTGQIYEVGSAVASEDGVPLFYALPSHYPGRNVPDVSFNADWNTGYLLYYTSSVSGFSIQSFWGGTSFVAPQLNGVTALLGEYLNGRRLGLLNYPLYGLALTGRAYSGARPPLRAIPYGDNWFYHGSDGYNRGVGLGTLDVANFAEFLSEF